MNCNNCKKPMECEEEHIEGDQVSRIYKCECGAECNAFYIVESPNHVAWKGVDY